MVVHDGDPQGHSLVVHIQQQVYFVVVLLAHVDGFLSSHQLIVDDMVKTGGTLAACAVVSSMKAC